MALDRTQGKANAKPARRAQIRGGADVFAFAPGAAPPGAPRHEMGAIGETGAARD
jgi:hypothetical protein